MTIRIRIKLVKWSCGIVLIARFERILVLSFSTGANNVIS